MCLLAAIAILMCGMCRAFWRLPQARSYGCDPPLELEASERPIERAGNMLHLQLQLRLWRIDAPVSETTDLSRSRSVFGEKIGK